MAAHFNEKFCKTRDTLVESPNAADTLKRSGLEEYANYKTENRFIVLLKSVYKTTIYSIYIGNSSEFFTRHYYHSLDRYQNGYYSSLWNYNSISS